MNRRTYVEKSLLASLNKEHVDADARLIVQDKNQLLISS